MKNIMKPLKTVAILLAITVLTPIVLVKLDYWPAGFAGAKIQYKDPYAPIHYGDAVLSYSQAVERAAPAVVSIQSTREMPKEANPYINDPIFQHFFGDLRGNGGQGMPEMMPSIGSGVIVATNGYILTNNHVIKGANDIQVRLSDGRTANAKPVGTDPDSDLAILKIELDNLPVIAIGDSSKLKVGDVVLAIGNPFAVGQTVTQGIVSATHRNELGINAFENFIQTDAAINPGNSGGALIDRDGNLIGINNAIYTRTGGYQGIGFAIPVNLVKDVMSELIETGSVTRGWLGITVRGLNDEIRKTLNYPEGEGSVIAGVIRGGPANKAGLQPLDIIVSVNDKKVQNPSDVLNATSHLKPDQAYNLTVVRNGETMDFKVIVGKRPTATN